MLKKYLVLAFFTIFSMSVQAQLIGTRQTTLTYDNYFPEMNNFEFNTTVNFSDFNDETEGAGNQGVNRFFLTPQGRFNWDNRLTFDASLPVGWADPESGGTQTGFGDARFGAVLKAYENIFDNTYVLPHAHLNLNTGEDEEYLGTGETTTTLGVSIGHKMYDTVQVIGDVSYDLRSDTENAFIMAASGVYSVSDRFSLVAEANFSDEDLETSGNGHPARFVGGFHYQWSESVHFTAHAGGGKNTREDAYGVFKVAYVFD